MSDAKVSRGWAVVFGSGKYAWPTLYRDKPLHIAEDCVYEVAILPAADYDRLAERDEQLNRLRIPCKDCHGSGFSSLGDVCGNCSGGYTGYATPEMLAERDAKVAELESNWTKSREHYEGLLDEQQAALAAKTAECERLNETITAAEEGWYADTKKHEAELALVKEENERFKNTCWLSTVHFSGEDVTLKKAALDKMIAEIDQLRAALAAKGEQT